jgi:apolipoprotein N-acyltransferase
VKASLTPDLSLPTLREIWLLACAAIGYFLAFPNPLAQFPPAALLMPGIIMIFSLENERPRKALALSFFSLMLGSSLCLYWLAIPMHDFAGVPWFIGACFVLLLGVYFGLYGLLFSLILRFLLRPAQTAQQKHPGQADQTVQAYCPDRQARFRQTAWLVIRLAAAALAWGALENLRGFFLTGFPWLSLSTAFVGWPLLAQGGALLGMYAMSALYVFAALLLFAAMLSGSSFLPGSPAPLKSGLAALLIFAVLASYGQSRLTRDWDAEGKPVLVGLVQGNVDQMQKWSLEKRAFTVRRYLDLSALTIEKSLREHGQNPDLLIWPETSMPFPFQLSPELARPVRDFAAAQDIGLLFGAQGRSYGTGGAVAADPQNRAYNRVWLLNGQGQNQGSYDKEHLVPFGEYLPPGLYVPFASEFLQGTGFTPGEPAADLPAGMRYKNFALGLLICYEVIFPELAQTRVKQGANLLVSVSNDAWFGRSSAPLQHLQQAAQRCIEQGRYLARATNTGISAAIDPAGRIRHPSALFTSTGQVERVSLLEETTFYHRHAETISLLLWILPIMALAERLVRRGRF